MCYDFVCFTGPAQAYGGKLPDLVGWMKNKLVEAAPKAFYSDHLIGYKTASRLTFALEIFD